MNPLLISAIRELKDDRGVTLDPLSDLAHIFRLKDLADAVLGIQADLRSKAVLRPVIRVGSVEFRRLSIGSIEFLTKQVLEWWKPESDEAVLSYAYCHANGHRPELIWGFEGQPDDWAAVIREWRKTVGVSWPELVNAVRQFQDDVSELDALLEEVIGPRKVEAAETPRGDSYGPLIDLLASQYAFTCPASQTPAEYWLWRVPKDEVEGMVEACINRIEMDDRKKRKPGAIGSDPNKLYIRAHFALRTYLDQIVAEKKGS